MPSDETIESAKRELRERIHGEMKRMTPRERAAASAQACLRLEQQNVWREARSILFYAPMADEVDTWRLLLDALAAGKEVFLPRYHPQEGAYEVCRVVDAGRDVRVGQFGIREPGESSRKIQSNRLDLILVPGIAFDFDGHRLGRGKGHYDQLLKSLQGTTCGVAFERQIVSHVPTGSHDVRLSCILTPMRWFCASEPRAVLK